MNSHSSFSIIIPAYNEERYLGKTIASVHDTMKAVNIHSYEIIVCDDGSSDRTSQIAREMGAVVTYCGKRHIAAARNKGAELAHGEYLIFLDADTLINAKTVSAMLQALQKGAVGGGALIKNIEQLPPRVQVTLNAWNRISSFLNVAAGAFIFLPKKIFIQIGGFDEQYYAGEEWYFSKKVKKLGRFIVLREPVETSARKLEHHSACELYLFLLKWLFMGQKILNSKKELDFWYAKT